VTAPERTLAAAVQSAAEELTRPGVRFEVFARLGETTHLALNARGAWRRREVREVGVACRVARRGEVGFAAAAGSSARAGSEAARSALAGLLPGVDPLPPRRALGSTPTLLPRYSDAPELEAFAHALAAAFDGDVGVSLLRLRTLAGTSIATLATGEGHLAHAAATGALVELLVATRHGPWRSFHIAAPDLAALDPAALAERVKETALLAARGTAPRRALADVLLAPAVAAPLVVALAEFVGLRSGRPPRSDREPRVSRAWSLVDERAGPGGLLAQPWDGEGLPARRIELLGGGRLGERLATWGEAQRDRVPAGGAVRASYRHPPAAGPANLVVTPSVTPGVTPLVSRLEEGFYVVMPEGAVHVERGTDRFALRAAAVAVRRGRGVATHPRVELRGSFRRLLAGLVAAGNDAESFSLACAVTTPSLLFHRLEIA
jgi:predicted Zn-dependent protease